MDSGLTREKALGALKAEMRSCQRCREAGFSITPGAVFSGPSSALVMIVGQAPGSTESDTGRPFNGPSGDRLFDWLARAGWEEASFRASHYMTAITKCYPGRSPNGKGDRVPSRGEQKLCQRFLERELALVRPELIIPVGSMAVQRFLGRVRLADIVGTTIDWEDGATVVPLPHPSGVNLWLNRQENQDRVRRALEQLSQLRRQRAL